MEVPLRPGCTVQDDGGSSKGPNNGKFRKDEAWDLKSVDWSLDEWTAAIHGNKIPHAMGRPTSKYCVIRGIRYHPGFATELRGVLPEFTRALNSRRIMSNDIPDMTRPDEFPYCIWHPEVATEDTYRQLAHRYPQLKYHVGRACAVAGYLDLYKELDLLPEVHIAEEARSNGNTAIFDVIMANNVIYNVMNDYNRTIDIDSPCPGHLNCDTAVRSSLEIKKKLRRPDHDWFDMGEEPEHDYSAGENFNITEDWNIDDHQTPEPEETEADDLTIHLCTPLPTHLPAIDKDLLILMSAYYGDIDRYARLRRPRFIQNEVNCVVRGIYHNTVFAKYWSLQKNVRPAVTKAITARFIMNDNLTRVKEGVHPLPYHIWYPRIASRETYLNLAQICPAMKPAVARVFIIMDYQQGYDKLGVEPDHALVSEAKGHKNPYYTEDLERKIAGGAKLKPPTWRSCDVFSASTLGWSAAPYPRKFLTKLCYVGSNNYIFNGVAEPDVSVIEGMLCGPSELQNLQFDEED